MSTSAGNVRITRRFGAELALVAVLLMDGCNDSESATGAASEGTTSVTSGGRTFPTPETLLEHLRALPATGEGKLASYDLIHPRSRTEEVSRKFLRDIDAAKLDYARSMNDVFGDGSEIEPTDLGMAQWLGELNTAKPPRFDKRYAILDYQSEAGEARTLVFVRAGGSWHVAAATLRGGVPVDDQWAGVQQGRWNADIKHYGDMASEVRAGNFATADEARAELERRLALPAPPMPGIGF